MKYVVDASEFKGYVITSMSDDIHSDYGGETLGDLNACLLKGWVATGFSSVSRIPMTSFISALRFMVDISWDCVA